MHDRKTGRARLPESLLSLSGVLHSLAIDLPCVLHNAGNDAFMTLVAFQWMMDPKGTVTMLPRGVGMGTNKGGSGHVKRAATVAARFFRPLGGTPPDPGANGKREPLQTLFEGRGGGADEMGMNVNMKRASMFSTLTLVPTDKHKKRASGGGSTSKSGSGGGGGWLSPSTLISGQRRHSTVLEKRL